MSTNLSEITNPHERAIREEAARLKLPVTVQNGVIRIGPDLMATQWATFKLAEVRAQAQPPWER